MVNIRQLMVTGGVLVGAASAFAGTTLDVSQPMLCAATEVIECVKYGECTKGPPDMFNLPVLFKVDTGNKVIESARFAGERRISAIASVAEADGVSVLLGADGPSGWSTTINLSNGAMTVASSREGASYTAFGTCTGP